MRLKRILLFAMAAFVEANAFADGKAEILVSDWKVDVASVSEAKLSVHERVCVNSKPGSILGVFHCFTDENTTLTSFAGTVESGGKVVKKLRKSDVISRPSSDNFADDTYINYYSPSGAFPYIVDYVYTISYKRNLSNYPSFFPVMEEGVAVKKASYSITVPEGITVRYYSSSEPQTTSDPKKGMTYRWCFDGYGGFESEHGMPPKRELVPFVYASPAEFNYLGHKGTQNNWSEVGKWLYDLVPEDAELPADLAAKVHEMTDSCSSDVSKLRVLYRYLLEHTRYVSIQFGIGGYMPASPARVHSTGYGDCKALSFFMKKLLAEAGVASDYAIVSTTTPTFSRGYAGLGQMNHAMLAVPLQGDTVWVECTNPLEPLGFRHSSIAGHQAVLIKENGGELVRARDYPDSMDTSDDFFVLELASDGKMSGHVEYRRRMGDSEAFINFRNMKRESQVSMLSDMLKCSVNDVRIGTLKENFEAWNGERDYCPEASISFDFTTSTYAKISGDRMILPLMPGDDYFTYQKSERKNDYVTKSWYTENTVLRITIPKGYEVEFLPSEFHKSLEFADFSIRSTLEGNVIEVDYHLHTKAFRLPAAEYGKFRDFAKYYRKAVTSSIILIKKR